MATVWVPSLMRDLTNGQDHVGAAGKTVGQLVDDLDRQYPGIKARLCAGDGLVHTLAVSVDGKLSRLGLLQPVKAQSEVRFLPAIEGG
jgi:molybdopterin converting factor small subunit